MDSINNRIDLLGIVYGDLTMGISGEKDGKTFEYIFNYGSGGLESMLIDGKEWVYRVPKPTFWRALTDNDRGNSFHLKSGMWYSADKFIKYKQVKVKIDGENVELPTAPFNNRFKGNETAEQVELEFSFETITIPSTVVNIRYVISKDGKIDVEAHYFGMKGLPELPVFGMRFVMPTAADGFRYKGLSGETYPDRMAGGIDGIYDVEGMPVTPYLVPQDCGMHMNTEWVEIFRTKVLDNRKNDKQRTSIRIVSGEKKIAFSCLPYTAQELENALHHEDLPIARRTVLCVYGAVRGVGGINSWGADVESSFHVDAEKDIVLQFSIIIP